MSKTYRYVPHWAGKIRYRRYLMDNPTSDGFRDVDKDRWLNGRDKHHATSRIVCFGWKEDVTGKTRKWGKRVFHKENRRKAKIEIRKELSHGDE